MERILFSIAIVTACALYGSAATAQTTQSREVPKYELAADFSSLSLDSGTSLPGVGGRFTYNLNEHFALEAAGFFFPEKCATCGGEVTGLITEGLFGVKVGKHFKKWGIFAKARTGFMSFSKGAFDIEPTGGGGPFPFTLSVSRRTHFAVDLGTVVEFYPSKRIVVRFDGGDTLLRYQRRTFNVLTLDPNTGADVLVPFTDPGRTRHNFQFISGVGFRF